MMLWWFIKAPQKGKDAFSFEHVLFVGVFWCGFFGEREFGELCFLICFSVGFGCSVVLLNNLANLSDSMSRPQIFSSMLYIALVLFFLPHFLWQEEMFSQICIWQKKSFL